MKREAIEKKVNEYITKYNNSESIKPNERFGFDLIVGLTVPSSVEFDDDDGIYYLTTSLFGQDKIFTGKTVSDISDEINQYISSIIDEEKEVLANEDDCDTMNPSDKDTSDTDLDDKGSEDKELEDKEIEDYGVFDNKMRIAEFHASNEVNRINAELAREQNDLELSKVELGRESEMGRILFEYANRFLDTAAHINEDGEFDYRGSSDPALTEDGSTEESVQLMKVDICNGVRAWVSKNFLE